MNAWPSMRLDQCCEIVSGATPSTSVAEFWDGDVYWATPKDLGNLQGPLIADTPRKITKTGLASCGATILPAGSVLLSSRAPIGHVAINVVPMATNQGFKSLIPNSELVNERYLYYWLRCNRDYLESLGNGATFKEVSKAVVSRVEIPVPALATQERIATILDQADALRVKRRAALARLDEMGRAIFVDMFGGPATLNKWPTVQLLEVLSIPLRNGVSPSSEGAIPLDVITLSAVTGTAFDSSARKPGLFQNQVPTDKRVNALDLLICRGNGNLDLVGRGFLPTTDLSDVAFPDTMIAARVSPEAMVPEFLETVWNAPFVREQIKTRARTTNGTFKVNQQALEDMRLPAPPMTLQQSFASRSAAVLKSSRLGRRHLSHLDTLFHSLQHRAFRGEL